MASNYFPHDSNARNSKKLLRLRARHGAEGYGAYFMILERLREEDGFVSDADYEMISFDLRVSPEVIKSVVEDFGLFEFSEDGTKFRSAGFDERMEISGVRSAAGKKGAESRWGKGKAENASTMAQNGKNMANDDFANGIKLNKIKEKEIKPSSSFSSSSSSVVSGKESEGEKEQQEEEILSLLFFSNCPSPGNEYERLVAWNDRPDAKGWSEMSGRERIAAAKLWKPSGTGRFKREFLDAWEGLYALLRKENAPPEVRMAALSDTVAAIGGGERLRLRIPDVLREWIEKPENIPKVSPVIMGYARSAGYSGISYVKNKPIAS
ncbi:MAG: DUF4373 domain-containing protein [Bacteroidales bacterium]|nr:DUF4373 domain-containing protein [Bacteroidales bacterium]